MTDDLVFIIASAAGRGQNHRRRAHVARPGTDVFSLNPSGPICGASADFGWSTSVPLKTKVCPRCKATLVERAANALLKRLDNMTTDSFANGGEKDEREALRSALELRTS